MSRFAGLVFLLACNSASGGGNSVTLHVKTDPERPVQVYVNDGKSRSAKVCDRAPCDVSIEKGKKVTLEAQIPGASGSIDVTADADKDVVIPLRMGGMPPPQPPPH